MSQKYNYIYYMLILALGFFAFFFETKIAIYLLMCTSMLAWFIKDLNQNKKVKFVERKFQVEKKDASSREKDADVKLKQLINTIPSPLVFINQRGNLEVSNDYFKTMIKIEPNNIYDKKIDSPIRHILLDAFLNEQQFVRQFEYESNDFQVHSIPIVLEKRYQGCMLVFQDVTQIAAGESRQKQFIADASHELKTPITSIKGMIEILNRPEFNDPETKKEFLLQVEKESIRLDTIVKDLVLQSNVRENRIYLEKEEFNLHQFFEALVLEKRKVLEKANIKFILNCPKTIEVFADQFRLGQVFMNLFDNSIAYSNNGSISINCTQGNHRIMIEFADTGTGIKEELLPFIFERFYRGESDRNRDVGGSGLGLAISKSIVEAHGGTIIVNSNIPTGTRFIIKLTQS